jgi:glycine/sarcosine N-methyltransferase
VDQASDVSLRVRAAYDELAPAYDRIYADWDASIRRQGEALQRLLVSRLGDRHPAQILDCTCGIGTQTLGLLQQGNDVTASDLSEAAARRARNEAMQRGLDAKFVTADMTRLPFTTGAFHGVVTADNSLPHLLSESALRSAMAEMARVTKPGGVLLVSTREYEQIRASRPPSSPPTVSGVEGARVITFQLWHWQSDDTHYDVEFFQLFESAEGWRVVRAGFPSWALSRSSIEAAAAAAGWTDMVWHEPVSSGFFQPVLLGTRMADGR